MFERKLFRFTSFNGQAIKNAMNAQCANIFTILQFRVHNIYNPHKMYDYTFDFDSNRFLVNNKKKRISKKYQISNCINEN